MTFKYENYVPHHEWWDSVYEDAKNIGELMGINIDNIYFSGFSSQGDGACFTGSYEYVKNSVKKIKEYAPLNNELHNIADTLMNIQKRHNYRLVSSINHSGHYNHSGCMMIDTEYEHDSWKEINGTTEDDLKNVLRSFADWIYKSLETEYDYQYAWNIAYAYHETDDEELKEQLSDNFHYWKDGKNQSIDDFIEENI